MRILNYLLVVCLAVSFCGCVVAFKNANEDNLSGISVGMSKDDVVESVGQPVEKRSQIVLGKEYDLWIYPIERFFAKQYNPLGYLYYEIVFFDDKVKEWYRTKLYSHPLYELDRHEAPEGARTFDVLQKKD